MTAHAQLHTALALHLNIAVACALSIPWLEQISRQEVLLAGCQHSQHDNGLNLDHILVDHTHKFLYCYVPKVACTNWKRVLLVLTGRVNTTDVTSIPASYAHSDGALQKLSELSDGAALSAMTNYTSFVMVRHPFERLLSAYRNKFEGDSPSAKYFQTIFGKHIIKTYRTNPSPNDARSGANVTFREFVRYLLAEGVSHDSANEHWRSIHRLCNPCQINYDFIGKYESFSEDADIILGMINAPKLTFPQTRSGHTADRLRLYYQQLPMEEIERLYHLYENDFRLFGYSLESVLGYDIG